MAPPISAQIICSLAGLTGPTQFRQLRPSGRIHRIHLPQTLRQAHGLVTIQSGVAGGRKWGPELTVLPAVDLEDKTAYYLEKVQTVGRLADQESLLDYYADIIEQRKEELPKSANTWLLTPNFRTILSSAE